MVTECAEVMSGLGYCSKCNPGFDLTIDWPDNSYPSFSCVQTQTNCTSGQYENGGVCHSCNDITDVGKLGCSVCSYDGTSFACSECDANYVENFTDSTYPCKQSCPGAQNVVNLDNTGCRTCDSIVSGCDECSDFSDTCTSCSGSNFLDTGNNSCEECHSTCDTCSGDQDDDCLGCSGGRYYQSGYCKKNCSTSHGYDFESFDCEICASKNPYCLNCEDGSFDCTTCAAIYELTPSKTCSLSCQGIEA
jgi:proprotein convertase subtilisin/kexin type 5